VSEMVSTNLFEFRGEAVFFLVLPSLSTRLPLRQIYDQRALTASAVDEGLAVRFVGSYTEEVHVKLYRAICSDFKAISDSRSEL
jgi:hypothetical protein